MFGFLRRALGALCAPLLGPVKSPLDVEIGRVERALLRLRRRHDGLVQTFYDEDMPCCPTCAFPELDDMGAKIERVEKQLTCLLKKRDRIVSIRTRGGTW